MKTTHYGSVQQTVAETPLERHVEEIRLRGFTLMENVVPPAALATWRERIDTIYAAQEKHLGQALMSAIGELDVCRAPLIHDPAFIDLASIPSVLELVRIFLGDWFILNLQNAVINRPGIQHHQSAWHRDLPYQNAIASTPLAINALFAIDEFSANSGGTSVIPYSHKGAALPSDAYIEQHQVVAAAPAGSVILFDAMLFHRAGFNSGSFVRRAVNHLYTIPIIKQQYDFPAALGERMPDDAALARLLGVTSVVPRDGLAWRLARAKKLDVKNNADK